MAPAEVQRTDSGLASRQRCSVMESLFQIFVHRASVTAAVRFSEHFQRTIYRIGCHGRATGHGFKHDQAKGFRAARKHKNVGGCVNLRQFRTRQRTFG